MEGDVRLVMDFAYESVYLALPVCSVDTCSDSAVSAVIMQLVTSPLHVHNAPGHQALHSQARRYTQLPPGIIVVAED